MGLLDRFFRPPTEDQFARQVLKTLRQVGDRREATYDKAGFRIIFAQNGESGGVINLRNLYIEFCNAARNERQAILRRSCARFAKPIEMPDDFEDVRPDLLPTIRPRSMLEVMRLDVEIGGSTWLELAAVPLSDCLVTCLVYDLPTTMEFVAQQSLDRWGVSLYEAAEIAKENLEQKEFLIGAVGEHLFVFVTGDAFDAARMLLLDRIRSLALTGQPVAIAVNRDCLMVTGADDIDGLEMLATLAEKKRNEARPICAIPHELVGDEWVAWLPPPDHPHHEKFRLLELGHFFGEYAEQKALLEKRHEQTGEEVFVATFSAVERNGKPQSYSVWTRGVPTWLPKTSFVGLHDPDSHQTGFVPWDRLQTTLGHLMGELDCYPPRWLVDGFPSPEQMQQLNPENWKQS